MKNCPHCAEEIQDAAIVCKHCGRDLKAGASQVQIVEAKQKTSPAAWGCLTVIILFAVVAMIGQCSSGVTPQSTSTTSAPAATPPANQLALISARGYESEGGGYHIVEGEVQNITNEPLKSVTAKATWYTKDGTLVTSDDALIDFNPLLPGQKSPFKTMSRTNPAMSKYTVTFKRIFGGEIPTDDRRKKQSNK